MLIQSPRPLCFISNCRMYDYGEPYYGAAANRHCADPNLPRDYLCDHGQSFVSEHSHVHRNAIHSILYGPDRVVTARPLYGCILDNFFGTIENLFYAARPLGVLRLGSAYTFTSFVVLWLMEQRVDCCMRSVHKVVAVNHGGRSRVVGSIPPCRVGGNP